MTNQNNSNHELINRARRGDKTAITTLYETHRQKVFRYLYYQLGDQQTAEDLTTEVFLRMIKNLPRYQPQAPFQAWLFQVARNLAIDHLRRSNRFKHTYLNERLIWDGDTPERYAERRLTSEQLQGTLDRLTADQRDVVVLRFVAEMPIAQVAVTMNKSESAVKALQARGLEALHRILSEQQVTYDYQR